MTTAITTNKSRLVTAAIVALALAAAGFTGAAEARSHVGISIGLALPGVQIGVGNAYPAYPAYPAYSAYPVYTQPAPVYVQSQPVYVQQVPIYAPRPVYYGQSPYYGQPVYVAPQPVFYGPPRHWRHHERDHDDDREGRGHYQHPGYRPVYYRR